MFHEGLIRVAKKMYCSIYNSNKRYVLKSLNLINYKELENIMTFDIPFVFHKTMTKTYIIIQINVI